ncbi:MAG: DsbA family protein [Patescibacteria group bacterium]|nr:DsbA family protein [Patescibacteria group bacterium]
MNEFIKYKTIVIELKKLRKNIFADSFWAFNDYLFTVDKVAIYDQAYMERILSSFNFDANKISECAKNPETIKIVAQQVRELQETGLYGTPTVFIDGRAFVGPKPYRVYRNELKRFILF